MQRPLALLAACAAAVRVAGCCQAAALPLACLPAAPGTELERQPELLAVLRRVAGRQWPELASMREAGGGAGGAEGAGQGGDSSRGSAAGRAVMAGGLRGLAGKAADGRTNVCAHCGGSGSGVVLVCKGCRGVSYCDAACQKANWAVHKSACSRARMQLLRSAGAMGCVLMASSAAVVFGVLVWVGR